jgi:hypothetical protein
VIQLEADLTPENWFRFYVRGMLVTEKEAKMRGVQLSHSKLNIPHIEGFSGKRNGKVWLKMKVGGVAFEGTPIISARPGVPYSIFTAHTILGVFLGSMPSIMTKQDSAYAKAIGISSNRGKLD